MRLAMLAQEVAKAKARERSIVEERNSAVVRAVRAGARLDEIGQCAGITKAAASTIARKRLAPRPGRGGPYSRRRGAEASLAEVQAAAGRFLDARRDRRRMVGARDTAIVEAVASGVAVRLVAEALGMESKVVHNLIRRRRSEATNEPHGAVASLVADEELESP